MTKFYKVHKNNSKFRSAASFNSISRKNNSQKVTIPFENKHNDDNQSLHDETIFYDIGLASLADQMDDRFIHDTIEGDASTQSDEEVFIDQPIREENNNIELENVDDSNEEEIRTRYDFAINNNFLSEDDELNEDELHIVLIATFIRYCIKFDIKSMY